MAFITFPKFLSPITETLAGTLDILFPRACLACGKTLFKQESGCFCEDCYLRIAFVTAPLCPQCGIPFIGAGASHSCGDCIKEAPPFAMARAMAKYDGDIAAAITAFKYGKNINIGAALADMFAAHRFADAELTAFDLVIPVPLHKNRLRQRGFNQSLALAKAFAKKHRLQLDFSSLIRSINTLPQTGLTKKLREENIKGAFILRDVKKIQNKSVIIVDDVYTTGSTIKECSRVIQKGGAKTVIALTAARAY